MFFGSLRGNFYWRRFRRVGTAKFAVNTKKQRTLHLFLKGKNGLYPTCKGCRKPASLQQYLNQRPEYKLYYRAKYRAKRKGLEFTITEQDIQIPELCPVFKTPMDVPSLDRINSKKGYTPNNIRVISNRANMLKNNATVEELLAVIEHIKGDINDG